MVNEDVPKEKGDQAAAAELAAISLETRIPDFWTDMPRVWFSQVESILSPQKAGETTSYNVVVAKLGKEVIRQVADIVANPPEHDRYKKLKERLLQIYEESETRKIQKLISEIELGDQRPTQLLRRMRELANGKMEDEALKAIWQKQLPSSINTVLAAISSDDLNNLAVVADRVMDSSRSSQVASVGQRFLENKPSTSSSSMTDTQMIMSEIAKINLRINEMGRRGGRSRFRNARSNSRSISRSGSQRRPRITPESPEWLCYYHLKYKGRANKCEKPCNWESKKNSENQDRFSQRREAATHM